MHSCWIKVLNQNQITFIVTSPQHKCLGEWNSYERAPDSAKNKTKQFTYGQYVFTDCTEDNVQNTHTYTQYTQCTIKTYLVIITLIITLVYIYKKNDNFWTVNSQSGKGFEQGSSHVAVQTHWVMRIVLLKMACLFVYTVLISTLNMNCVPELYLFSHHVNRIQLPSYIICHLPSSSGNNPSKSKLWASKVAVNYITRHWSRSVSYLILLSSPIC